MTGRIDELNNPSRINDLKKLISKKGFLRSYYNEVYSKYEACLGRCPKDGIVLELGSGASFIKERIPETITSDVLAYDGVDKVIDATQLPFPDRSLRAIFMMNVFHHIPNIELFLKEAMRCLKPGGRVFISDQHVGWMSKLMFARLHHEPFMPDARDWKFESTGPLSGANGALTWIVFQRDRKRFEKLFPKLKISNYEPHSPFRYWLAGGLSGWALAPGWSFGAVSLLEKLAVKLHPHWCSFVDVELVKITDKSKN